MTPDFRWFAHYEPDVVHSVDVPDGTVQQLLLDLRKFTRFPDHSVVAHGAALPASGTEGTGQTLSYAELNQLSVFACRLVSQACARATASSDAAQHTAVGDRLFRYTEGRRYSVRPPLIPPTSWSRCCGAPGLKPSSPSVASTGVCRKSSPTARLRPSSCPISPSAGHPSATA